MASKAREKQVRWLAHIGVAVLLIGIGYLTDLVILRLEPPGQETLLRYILTLLAPAAISTLIIAELAVKWQLDNWYESKKDALSVKTFANAVEFARFRRDIVMGIEVVDDPIYCTSHCNLFRNIEAKDAEKSTIREINREFFRQMAELSISSKRGGLRLLLEFKNEEEAREELAPRIDIFLDVAQRLGRDFDIFQFDVCRLLQPSVKDYFVIEDHVFKTIRKTRPGTDTQYLYVKNAEIAVGYRTWLADLFANGHAVSPTPFTENENMRRLFDRIRAEVETRRNLPMPGLGSQGETAS